MAYFRINDIEVECDRPWKWWPREPTPKGIWVPLVVCTANKDEILKLSERISLVSRFEDGLGEEWELSGVKITDFDGPFVIISYTSAHIKR